MAEMNARCSIVKEDIFRPQIRADNEFLFGLEEHSTCAMNDGPAETCHKNKHITKIIYVFMSAALG